MGIGALRGCGVTDLGPQTADPDARSASRSGGAATMCRSWWSRLASVVPVVAPLMWELPPLLPPLGHPPHTSQAFPHWGGCLFLGRAFPGRAGWRGRLRAPPLL